MGLSGARNSAVTGLQAQSTSISISADNIANAATPGYKAVKSQFSTLVTSSGASSGYSSGGVSVNAQNLIEKQGLIETTGRVTDLAVSGVGFFAVQDDSGNLLLTRAGSFDINNKGELVNPAGLKLLGWPLNNDGLRPGETGNSNTTAAESTNSLVVVDTNSASGTAAATSTIAAGLNLDAGQVVFQGATVTFDPASAANSTVAQGDILVPAAGVQEGDQITITSNSIATTLEYGGFAKSADLTVDAIFGATTTNATFTADATLVDGDQFRITTIASGAVTFTFEDGSPNTSVGFGQFNSLDTLATAINAVSGLTARTSGGQLFVSSTLATEAITFTDVSGRDLPGSLGLSNELAAVAGINRWNTIGGLATLVNAQADLNSVINSASSSASLDIFSSDPLLTLTVAKTQGTVTANLQSAENGTISSTELIVPANSGMAKGDTFVINDDQDATGNTVTATYGGFGVSADITVSSIFGATTATGAFVDGTNGLDYTDIITFDNGTDTIAVTFAATPAVATEFNSLTTLASAISSGGDFVTRIVDNKLYISSDTATEGVTFTITDTDASNVLTTASVATALGGDIAAGVVVAAGGAGTFNSIASLETAVEVGGFFTGTVANASGNATLAIASVAGTLTIGNSSDELVKELGLADNHDVGDGFFTELGITGTVAATAASAIVAVTYDPTDLTKNMAGGNITPHFSRNMEVFDALGTGHNFRLSFLKTGVNEWATEFYALTAADVTGSTDGQVAAGTLTFNGDGTLNAITSGLSSAITIPWTTGSTSNTLTFDLGTAGEPTGTVGASVIGLTDGLRQFDATYNVEFIEQNGVAAGQFKGISVSDDGTVNANFSNGEIKAIYQLPILTVANQNALLPQTGNTFAVSQASGEVNLKVAGQGGSGTVVPGALEGSTADIAEELTKTIGIQSNYNANATLISTVRDMEEELNRRL